jgi:polyhydroxybutyrate depolymerase
MRKHSWRRLGLVLAAALALGSLAGCGTAASGQAGEESTPSQTTTAATTVPTNYVSSAAYSSAIRCTSFPTVGRLPPIICRPSGLSQGPKVPLLVALHGADSNALGMQGLSHFEQVAVQHGFVVAFLDTSDPAHAWAPLSDVSYIGSMITKITSSQNIDPSRVYIAGFSAGGAEAWRDACMLSGQVTAIAIVSDTMSSNITCSLAKPISQLLIVGTDDGIRWSGVPGRLPSASQTATRWRGLDQCGTQVTTQQVSVVKEQTWTSCADGTQVGFYAIAGAQHVWPPYGVGAPKNYPTSQEVWSFLSRFRASPTSLSSANAAVLSLSAHHSGRRRQLVAAVRLDESMTAAVIARGPNHATLRKQVKLRAGRHQITLTVPARVRGGRYAAQFIFEDMYKRHLTVTRHVRLASLPKVQKPKRKKH